MYSLHIYSSFLAIRPQSPRQKCGPVTYTGLSTRAALNMPSENEIMCQLFTDTSAWSESKYSKIIKAVLHGTDGTDKIPSLQEISADKLNSLATQWYDMKICLQNILGCALSKVLPILQGSDAVKAKELLTSMRIVFEGKGG